MTDATKMVLVNVVSTAATQDAAQFCASLASNGMTATAMPGDLSTQWRDYCTATPFASGFASGAPVWGTIDIWFQTASYDASVAAMTLCQSLPGEVTTH